MSNTKTTEENIQLIRDNLASLEARVEFGDNSVKVIINLVKEWDNWYDGQPITKELVRALDQAREVAWRFVR